MYECSNGIPVYERKLGTWRDGGESGSSDSRQSEHGWLIKRPAIALSNLPAVRSLTFQERQLGFVGSGVVGRAMARFFSGGSAILQPGPQGCRRRVRSGIRRGADTNGDGWLDGGSVRGGGKRGVDRRAHLYQLNDTGRDHQRPDSGHRETDCIQPRVSGGGDEPSLARGGQLRICDCGGDRPIAEAVARHTERLHRPGSNITTAVLSFNETVRRKHRTC